MKRTLCLILILAVMLILLGCHYREGGEILEPVEFFYPRKSSSFIYGSSEGVIAPEVREAISLQRHRSTSQPLTMPEKGIPSLRLAER